MFLAIVATLRGVYVGIEQPSSSMLMYVPHLRMLAALAGMNWRHVKTHLACWRTLLMFRCKTARICGGIQFVLCFNFTLTQPASTGGWGYLATRMQNPRISAVHCALPASKSLRMFVYVYVCVCVSAVRI